MINCIKPKIKKEKEAFNWLKKRGCHSKGRKSKERAENDTNSENSFFAETKTIYLLVFLRF